MKDKAKCIFRLSYKFGSFSLVFLLQLVSLECISQQQGEPVTRQEASGTRMGKERLIWGYQTAVQNWTVKEGDTLALGRGTMPDKSFAFLYQNPSSLGATFQNGRLVKRYLPSEYSAKRVIVKELGQNGTRKQGFTMYAVVGVGMPFRYYAEIDNAIEAGELLPPPSLRKSVNSSQPVSVADELIKLKSLLDSGAITREEYDQQKKRLLNP